VTSIRWTAPAADQLEAIVNYIRDDNPEAARRFAQTVIDRIAQLEVFPKMGRPGEDGETRELVAGSCIVVYWLVGDVVEILQIWHGAQDWQ
jgi:plasmid stabilization system protein ParE